MVAVLGAPVTMFLSGLLYSCYIAVFIVPTTWSFYLTSVVVGVAAAMLWTAQSHFLVDNSDASNINRNTALFWALLQCSMLFGNLYIYFAWKGSAEISERSRKTLFTALLVTSGVGALSFLLLRKTSWEQQQQQDGMITDDEGRSLLSAPRMMYKQRANMAVKEAKSEFKTVLLLLKTKTILLLSCCMAYTGLELSFYSGVYGTCIGATAQFGDAAKGLIGMSGIVVGIGEIIGGGFFGLMCKNNRFRRTSVVFLGMVVHFVAFYLIFLSIPDDAALVLQGATRVKSYLTPSVSIALLCSFLLGLGDSCFNTQLYSILGCVYAEHSAPAFAIFKFIQSIFAALAFFYSGYLLLRWQLLLLVLLGFSGTLCFFLVERTQHLPADGLQQP